jgi:hypothetical protein
VRDGQAPLLLMSTPRVQYFILTLCCDAIITQTEKFEASLRAFPIGA